MSKYYTVKSKVLAQTLVWLTGVNYYTFDDLKEGGKIYSFENSNELQSALTELNDIRRKYSK